MLPIRYTLGPLQNASANLYVTSVTPTSGTPLTLTGSAPDVPRQVLLTYGSEGSARTMVVQGTNHTGNYIAEVLAVPSGGSGTVATVNSFATVTRALPLGGGWTAAVTLGTNGVASTPWIPGSAFLTPYETTLAVTITGTANATVEYTESAFDSFVPNLGVFSPGVLNTSAMSIWKHATLVSLTSSTDGVLTSPVHAFRLTLNSGSGSALFEVIQAGIKNG